jgi:2-oxoglutarate ferredoxin oxidoreductase subunit gamma
MNYKNQERVEIRFGGSGGQGLVLASVIMAEALVKENWNIITGESHGIEARGGASLGELIASMSDIYDLTVLAPDVFATLHQDATDKYYKEIKKDAIVIVDTFFVKDIPDFDSKNVLSIPLTQKVVEGCGSSLPANMAAIGAVYELTRIVKKETLETIITGRVPKGTEEMNLKAFNIGVKLAAG